MKKVTCFMLLAVAFAAMHLYAQKEITAVQPADGAKDVNVGIIKWSGVEGSVFDLYLGTSSTPKLYKADLKVVEEKPVVLALNSTYYWKVVEKKDGKEVRSSKVFSFSTLPIKLNPAVKYNSFVDTRDYKIYWTITVGGKEWFAQNLDYDLQGNSWYYDNAPVNKVYGKLYPGSALSGDQTKICPQGWRIPTEAEWKALADAFGGTKEAGSALKDATDTFWRKSNSPRTNSSGFTILPSGSRDSKPSFSNQGKYTFFWTSTPSPKIKGSFINIDLGFMRNALNINVGDPLWSYSIRCVRDASATGSK